VAGYGGLSLANIEYLRNHLGNHWTDEDISDWIYKSDGMIT
jgi:hypothetical protein